MDIFMTLDQHCYIAPPARLPHSQAGPGMPTLAGSAGRPERECKVGGTHKLAQHTALFSQGPAASQLGGESKAGQEGDVDTLGNEATIWYFLLKHLQMGK